MQFFLQSTLDKIATIFQWLKTFYSTCALVKAAFATNIHIWSGTETKFISPTSNSNSTNYKNNSGILIFTNYFLF